MHTAIPYTGSTADQAVSTVIQLGAAKHLTRPLTVQRQLRKGTKAGKGQLRKGTQVGNERHKKGRQ